MKDRLDGNYGDPWITPNLASFGGNKRGAINDGVESSNTYFWDSDRGIKDPEECGWNYGHMRVYARGGSRNYNTELGY